MTDLHIGDPSLKYPILISSIPTAVDEYSVVSGTVSASSQFTIRWLTSPANKQLTLWDFHWEVRLGTDEADSVWPDGFNLTANQALTQIYAFTDAVESDDETNTRVNKITIRNESASTFSFFMYFKSYSFASAVGVSGEQE